MRHGLWKKALHTHHSRIREDIIEQKALHSYQHSIEERVLTSGSTHIGFIIMKKYETSAEDVFDVSFFDYARRIASEYFKQDYGITEEIAAKLIDEGNEGLIEDAMTWTNEIDPLKFLYKKEDWNNEKVFMTFLAITKDMIDDSRQKGCFNKDFFKLSWQLYCMKKNLSDIGIPWMDSHMGNIVYEDGNAIAIDIGFAQSTNTGEILKLENVWRSL
jgi:hypothetical protein